MIPRNQRGEDSMAHYFETLLAALGLVGLACLLWVVRPARAQPTVDQVLADAGLSSDVKQRVLNGEFYSGEVTAVSDKDLSVSIAFLVKTSPDDLSKQIMSGDFVTADPQVQAHGVLSPAASLADLAELQITTDIAQAFMNAEPGSALNLSTSEISAFSALQGGTQQAVQQQLQQTLLARFQAYQTSGLTGIAPYDRGGGNTSSPGNELREASQAAAGLQKYLPAFQKALLGYPQATVPGMQQKFYWLNYNISGKPTFVLTQIMAAPDGAARAVVQRQYYVSTGYNSEQAVAGFLPVQGGTVVVYANHTFTDQVAGWGGSMKRSIGRTMMASKLKQLFDTARGMVTQ
jgi:hypothetical protein